MEMNAIDKTAYVLVMVGGLIWGLIGFFNWSLLDELGFSSGLQRVIYAIVGIAAVYMLYTMVMMMSDKKKA